MATHVVVTLHTLMCASFPQTTFHDPLHTKALRGFRERYCALWDAVVAEAHKQVRAGSKGVWRLGSMLPSGPLI